ncbi:MAG: hypothetical protein JWO41_98 [Candidatus Saccharibacteria bacterium]|nr:hypothetical protein [Candidatus Saccharibacteria bacterium]
MANNKTTKQYSSGPKFLHRFSQRQLTALIVTLGVGVLGVWTLILSSATTPVGVDFVLFCPPAGQTCAGSTSTVQSYANSVQSWYASRLGSGHTFKIHAVTIRYAPHATSYYSNGGSDANNAQVFSRVAADLGIVNSSASPIKTQVVTGFRVFYTSLCGFSSIPGSLSIEDSQNNPATRCAPSGFPQLIAHELGHSFGLQHVSTLYDVMNPKACFDGTYTAALSSCNMSSTERSYLLNNYPAWFGIATATGTLSCLTNSTNVTLTYSFSNVSGSATIFQNTTYLKSFPGPLGSGNTDGGAVRPSTSYTYILRTSTAELKRIICTTKA